MNSPCIVVLVTAKDAAEAERISRKLLDKKLIACVNIVKGVRSLFWWQGKVDQSDEVLLIIKSQQVLFGKIVETVKAVHSYDVPEILALPVIEGNQDYLAWMDASIKKQGDS